MEDSGARLQRETSWQLSVVLAAVGEEADPALGLPDRIDVRQATPTEWTYRFTYRGRREPVGGFLQVGS